MRQDSPVLFGMALNTAVKAAKSLGSVFGNEIVLVRDLRGRIRVLLPGYSKDFSEEKKGALDNFTKELSEKLGAYGYPPDRAILYTNDLVQGDQILISGDRQLISDEDGLKIWLLDRQIIGQDWMRAPLQRETENPGSLFSVSRGALGARRLWQFGRGSLRDKGKGLDIGSGPGISWRQQYLASSGLPAGLWHRGLVCRRRGRPSRACRRAHDRLKSVEQGFAWRDKGLTRFWTRYRGLFTQTFTMLRRIQWNCKWFLGGTVAEDGPADGKKRKTGPGYSGQPGRSS